MVSPLDGGSDASETKSLGRFLGLVFFVVIVAVVVFVVSPFFGLNVFEDLLKAVYTTGGAFDFLGGKSAGEPSLIGSSCSPSTCSNQGTCTIVDWEVTCLCNRGYSGSDCSQCAEGYFLVNGACVLPFLPPMCASLSCSGHGECRTVGNELFCVCSQGYSGPNCSSCASNYHFEDSQCIRDTVCVSDSCSGHGTCSVVNNVLTCLCTQGYTGPDCNQCAGGYSRSGEFCRQVVLPLCGNNLCQAGETSDNCPVDCFFQPPWRWPASNSNLDAGSGLNLHVSVNPDYYEGSRNVLFQHRIIVNSSLPSGFSLQYPDFVHQFNPAFSVSDYNAPQHYEAFVNYPALKG